MWRVMWCSTCLWGPFEDSGQVTFAPMRCYLSETREVLVCAIMANGQLGVKDFQDVLSSR